MSDAQWTTTTAVWEPDRPGAPNAQQRSELSEPIDPRRVKKQQGQSYIEGWDVSAHLTRIFGHCRWDKEIVSLDLIGERSETTEKNGKPRVGWWVTYRCHMRLRVYDGAGFLMWENDDAATGSSQNQPDYGEAHDLACKNAVTYALKRCAKDLGDQFGLSLYDGGSVAPVVDRTAVSAHDRVVEQKKRLAEACGGDVEVAKSLWGGRTEPLSDDELEDLLTEARQRT